MTKLFKSVFSIFGSAFSAPSAPAPAPRRPVPESAVDIAAREAAEGQATKQRNKTRRRATILTGSDGTGPDSAVKIRKRQLLGA